MITRALISVSDKTGLIPFAQFLVAQGVELLSTGGTAKLLKEQNIPVRDVSEVTNFPEMMDGRVKTLHPLVHGGLLARRGEPEHMEAARAHGIGMIDLLEVNLYPFETTLNATTDYDTLVENIDIGGPAMIRAAAKNHESVTVIVDPADYALVQQSMQQNGGAIPEAERKRFAAKAFARTAAYDTLIASWLSGATNETPWPDYLLDAKLATTLRYGENPHQAAALYQRLDAKGGLANAIQLQGKELSYNNLADAEAAWQIASGTHAPTAVLIKHANPCGVATDDNLITAFQRALASDPVSAFGGILAINGMVDAGLVSAIGSLFLEVIIAHDFTAEARTALSAKKNLRLLIATPETHASPLAGWMIQAISGGYLVQQQDKAVTSHQSPVSGEKDAGEWKLVTGDSPSAAQMRDAALAWHVVKYVKSNAIVLVKDGATIGVGAGQMSRVDSVRIAIEKARTHGHDPRGAVLASDAFFPFADNVELAAEAGIGLIIQPGGSMRDGEVIAAAQKHRIAMLFTGMRHFRH
jgi:phosphoribosylaminoimidazolecarboxamide formyltransferase/IMP cyclohydrolase